MMHVTQGRLERYIGTAIMLTGQGWFDAWWDATGARNLPRRALLKALRDLMTPRLNHAARTPARHRWADIERRIARFDESPPPRARKLKVAS